MKRLTLLISSFEEAIDFINHHLVKVIPFSALFFVATLMYSVSWYVLDLFGNIACINGNYVIELLFCNLYLGILGKHIIAVIVSSFTIVVFASLVYLTDKSVKGGSKGIIQSIVESIPGIVKILTFRALLTIILFLPFVVYLIFGGDIITTKITDTGRLTIQKMFTIDLLPIPVSLLLGFTLLAILEPVFQYVEYEVLIMKSRVRDAIARSYAMAMRYKTQSFVFGLMFVFVWWGLILFKFLYLVHPLLVIALLAAIFLESFLIFPLRTISLYFLWKNLSEGYEQKSKEDRANEFKAYMNKMLLG